MDRDDFDSSILAGGWKSSLQRRRYRLHGEQAYRLSHFNGFHEPFPASAGAIEWACVFSGTAELTWLKHAVDSRCRGFSLPRCAPYWHLGQSPKNSNLCVTPLNP